MGFSVINHLATLGYPPWRAGNLHISTRIVYGWLTRKSEPSGDDQLYKPFPYHPSDATHGRDQIHPGWLVGQGKNPVLKKWWTSSMTGWLEIPNVYGKMASKCSNQTAQIISISWMMLPHLSGLGPQICRVSLARRPAASRCGALNPLLAQLHWLLLMGLNLIFRLLIVIHHSIFRPISSSSWAMWKKRRTHIFFELNTTALDSAHFVLRIWGIISFQPWLSKPHIYQRSHGWNKMQKRTGAP